MAAQKACRIEADPVMTDHMHMLMAISPKYSVAHVIGCIEGKAANRAGYRYFTSVDTFRAYVHQEIIAMHEEK